MKEYTNTELRLLALEAALKMPRAELAIVTPGTITTAAEEFYKFITGDK